MHLIQLYCTRKTFLQGGEVLRTAWPLVRIFMDQAHERSSYQHPMEQGVGSWGASDTAVIYRDGA